MNKSKNEINEEPLIIIFAFTIVAVEFLFPVIFGLSINQWTQYLAYIGAMLLGLQFLGEKRLHFADTKIASHAREISNTFNWDGVAHLKDYQIFHRYKCRRFIKGCRVSYLFMINRHHKRSDPTHRPRGLMLSPEKTRIVRIEDGFDFLGQHMRKFRNKLITTPSKENRKSFLDGIRREIKNCKGSKTEDIITRLNPEIRGWVNYHKLVQSARAFACADTVIYEALMKWARRRHPNKGPGWIRKKYFSLAGQKSVFSCKSKEQNEKYKIHKLLKPAKT